MRNLLWLVAASAVMLGCEEPVAPPAEEPMVQPPTEARPPLETEPGVSQSGDFLRERTSTQAAQASAPTPLDISTPAASTSAATDLPSLASEESQDALQTADGIPQPEQLLESQGADYKLD